MLPPRSTPLKSYYSSSSDLLRKNQTGSYWFTLGDLHGIEGRSYLLSNKPGVAVEHLQQAVAGTDAAFTRDRALWLNATATAQVLNGDLEEGRHTAENALVILGEGPSNPDG